MSSLFEQKQKGIEEGKENEDERTTIVCSSKICISAKHLSRHRAGPDRKLVDKICNGGKFGSNRNWVLNDLVERRLHLLRCISR